MDNITHSLVGVALADAMSGPRAAKSRRSLLVGAGLVATNLPDIDLAYSAITPAPIGYLLHHRGHTHTVLGVGLLAFALVLAYRLTPPVRAMRHGERLRLWLLIAMTLASHIVLDGLNSYGVHPFYPIDNRWYFGDAMFIFEPSLWLVLGVAVAWNARSGTSKLVAALPIAILLVTIVSMDVMPVESAAILGLAGAWFAWLARRMTPRARASSALALSVLVIAVQLVAAGAARAESRRSLRPLVRGRLVDVILTPNPSSPLCWSLIGIDVVEATDEYRLWRGTLSLAPALKPPASCPLERLAEPGRTRVVGDGHFMVRDEIRQPLGPLRELSRRDCWIRAWLRFGRAPVIEAGEIFDLRFADRRVRAFTHMTVVRKPDPAPCPSFVPGWEMPRQDLLQP